MAMTHDRQKSADIIADENWSCVIEKSADFSLEVPVVIRLTCDCAVADYAVMPIRAESSS